MTKQKAGKTHKRITAEIHAYDCDDTTLMIDQANPLKLNDLGFKLPDQRPTQVVPIRIPTELLNEIKALGSERDVPYQALIKLFLRQGVDKTKRRQSA